MTKKTILLALAVILIGTVLIAGCTTPISRNPVPSYETSQQLTNNTYFINCDSIGSCNAAIKSFETNHEVISLAAIDSNGYGMTAGYYVITRQTP